MEVVLGDNFNCSNKFPDESQYRLWNHKGKCWYYGNWVVHPIVHSTMVQGTYDWVQEKGKYTITHNPTGVYIDSYFTNSKKAVEAMKLYQGVIDPFMNDKGQITGNYEDIIAIRRKVYEEYK